MFRLLLATLLILVSGTTHAVSCGETIEFPTVLTSDLHCTDGPYALRLARRGADIYLNGHVITGPRSMIGIQVESSEVTIRNGELRGFGVGITATARAHEFAVYGIKFEDMATGIKVDASHDLDIAFNGFSNIAGMAIKVRDDRTLAGPLVIRNNTFQNVRDGVQVCGPELRGGIIDNELAGVGVVGIHVQNTKLIGDTKFQIRDNLIQGVGDTAIILSATSDVEIIGNIIEKSKRGIALKAEYGPCYRRPTPHASNNGVIGNFIAALDVAIQLGTGTTPERLVYDNTLSKNTINAGATGIHFRTDAHRNRAPGNTFYGTTVPILDEGLGNTY